MNFPGFLATMCIGFLVGYFFRTVETRSNEEKATELGYLKGLSITAEVLEKMVNSVTKLQEKQETKPKEV